MTLAQLIAFFREPVLETIGITAGAMFIAIVLGAPLGVAIAAGGPLGRAVNALALLIFSAQFPQFAGASWQMYAMVAAGLAIIYTFPLLTRAIPSPRITWAHFMNPAQAWQRTRGLQSPGIARRQSRAIPRARSAWATVI